MSSEAAGETPAFPARNFITCWVLATLVVLLPAHRSLDAIQLLLDGEVELDRERVRLLIDEFEGALTAAAMVSRRART